MTGSQALAAKTKKQLKGSCFTNYIGGRHCGAAFSAFHIFLQYSGVLYLLFKYFSELT